MFHINQTIFSECILLKNQSCTIALKCSSFYFFHNNRWYNVGVRHLAWEPRPKMEICKFRGFALLRVISFPTRSYHLEKDSERSSFKVH